MSVIRYPYTGVARDGSGNIITSATIKVFETGTTTPVTIYSASTGGVALTSVTSDSTGTFIFYVSNASYPGNQQFRIRVEKSGYTPHNYDGIIVFGLNYLLDEPVSVSIACTDLPSVVSLCNELRQALIDKGLCA
jgi:hypothetical protein